MKASIHFDLSESRERDIFNYFSRLETIVSDMVELDQGLRSLDKYDAGEINGKQFRLEESNHEKNCDILMDVLEEVRSVILKEIVYE